MLSFPETYRVVPVRVDARWKINFAGLRQDPAEESLSARVYRRSGREWKPLRRLFFHSQGYPSFYLRFPQRDGSILLVGRWSGQAEWNDEVWRFDPNVGELALLQTGLINFEPRRKVGHFREDALGRLISGHFDDGQTLGDSLWRSHDYYERFWRYDSGLEQLTTKGWRRPASSPRKRRA